MKGKEKYARIEELKKCRRTKWFGKNYICISQTPDGLENKTQVYADPKRREENREKQRYIANKAL